MLSSLSGKAGRLGEAPLRMARRTATAYCSRRREGSCAPRLVMVLRRSKASKACLMSSPPA